MAPRIVCLLADEVPVQVARQRYGARPLIIHHPIATDRVLACSPEAVAAGVSAGQPVHQARLRAPQALVLAPEEAACDHAQAALQRVARAYAPVLETVGLGEVLLEARGLGAQPADEPALATALAQSARDASGLSVRLGLAAGKFPAQQAARAAPPDGVRVVAAGEEAAFLAPLPLAALPHLSGEVRRRLSLFDLHTLGDLAALRKPAVLRQFGGELASLYELARGHDPRPLNGDAPPLRVFRSLLLTEPVRERTIVLNVVQRLARQLSRALAAHGQHAEALKVALLLEDGREVALGRAAKPPTSDAARLGRLAAHVLGRLSTPAPVVRVVVSAYPLRAWHLGMLQRRLAEAADPGRPSRLAEALQLLTHRFGGAVVRLAALLGPPLPLAVEVALTPAGAPGRFRLGGRTHVVLEIDEHWREERQWWSQPVRRDYFRVQLGDGAYRNLYQDLISGAWFLDRRWPL